ncbi:MAG: acetate--CoA ligase family protein [Deltaproteobacteria bacterium]|nr:acetate--CoA ligase family protein [Deltaproteobacteria bacterium]
MDSSSSLDAVFRPRSVAVIGASTVAGKLGHDILYNLIHGGFPGPIYPINPKADQVLGLPAYKQIGDAPSPPDLAVVVIPARAVAGAIEQCGQAGVKGAIVITGGFAEAGPEGEKLQEELAQTARRHGVRLIGPNCQGLNNPHHQLCASWPLLTTPGGMAFISQSGTVGAALMDWASQDRLGVSVFVSLGNRADIDEADAIEYFNQDPHTKVIALYIEGVKRPIYFQDALAGATKPVVILKAGRTAQGRLAAESHTKSLAGSDAVYEAIFRKYKVHRADTIEELYDFAKGLAYLPKPKGRRLLNITSSGGAAILAIDAAEKLGFQTPAPSPVLQAKLREIVPAHCAVGNPVDLTGDVMSDPGLYAKVIDAARPEYDTLVVIFGDPIPGASQIVTPGAQELVIFLGGAEVERQEAPLMHQKGIPVFPTPERGLATLHQFFRFEAIPVLPEAVEPPSAPGLSLVPPGEAAALLAKHGIPVAACPLATTADEAVALAAQFGGPVALKIASPDLPHKTDVGGVRLHLTTEAEIREEVDDLIKTVLMHSPQARLDGVIVSPMAKPGGLEIILGVFTDPQYGATLMFGLGGIFTEIYQDVQFCLLPAKDEEFWQMIRGIRGYPLLSGARGQTPKDQEALVEVMKALARVATANPHLDQIELNPLLVYDRGVFAVDVRVYSRVSS